MFVCRSAVRTAKLIYVKPSSSLQRVLIDILVHPENVAFLFVFFLMRRSI